MRIYSMTATFGKLEHETLTLEPGLNVIHAPNEWGKSTWCAFLLNMLYGIDTRERTKQGALANKDRYAPWSGAAMSGRIELNWKGRDITIERSSNARIPMGVFRAYETETGIDIPELTGANCGQQLLGVERNVFTRAGFLRLNDLPVTQDDALRRRLNNLVTTGDESGAGDMLGQSLKDLKNKCRSNKSNGLLPEAEAQRDQLRDQLRSLQELKLQAQQIQTRQAELEQQLHALENHQATLEYQASLENREKVAQAQQAAAQAQDRADQLAATTLGLPSRQEAQAAFLTAGNLQEELNRLNAQRSHLPEEPVRSPVPTCFEGLSPTQAQEQAQQDCKVCQMLTIKQKARSRRAGVLCILSAVLLAALIFALYQRALGYALAGAGILAATLALAAVSAGQARKCRRELQALYSRYPGQGPDTWLSNAQRYSADTAAYEAKLEAYHQQTGDFTRQQEDLSKQIQAFAPDGSLSDQRARYEQAIQAWEQLAQAQKDAQQARQHAEALAAVAKTVEPPKEVDTLQYSAQMTADLLANARFEQRQLENKLGQCMGQMEALGNPAAIQAKLDTTVRRIARLETYNSAIEMAQDALFKATVALQRRFSPRITKRAQALFSKLTANRYQRITMAEDMSLSTAAGDEVTLQELRRRSDGTIDQLYFALRLAVAEELTPEAPLVLDDALVRFDETRLTAAMALLKEEAQNKQVILFTCQRREEACL